MEIEKKKWEKPEIVNLSLKETSSGHTYGNTEDDYFILTS